MAFTINGRLVGSSGSPAGPVAITLKETDTARSLARPVQAEHDGSFTIASDKPPPGPAFLDVTDSLGSITRLDIDGAASSEALVIVLPSRAKDPRTVVAEVAESILAEREATASARAVLAEEFESRTVNDEAVDEVVNAVLAQLAVHGGGDLAWKAGTGESIPVLTAKAIAEACTRIDESTPLVVARENNLSDGEEITTGELVSRLTGGRTHREGFWRADPLERLSLREANATPDGLPRPMEREGPPDGPAPGRNPTDPPATNGSIAGSLKSKAHGLVEAIRLPEDPPLLLADSAITGRGADVEFVRGVSDVTAFHDVSELVLAMPNIWQEVFDQHFIDLLQTVVGQLLEAGVDARTLVAPVRDGAKPGIQILKRFKSLEAIYETSSAGKIRLNAASMLTTTTTAIASGVTDPATGVLYKDNSPGPGEGSVLGERFEFGAEENQKVNAPVNDPPRVVGPPLLRELEGYLTGKHGFTIFAADGAERAINFGLLLTWRQLWKPLNYQAGEIVRTITLAPGAEQTVITKRKRTLKRYTAEVEKAQSSRALETTDTTRAESEILRKASAATNFQMTSEGSTKLLVSDGSFTTSATRDVGREGNSTRRRFREAVMKAAQEYREEHSMEVKTEAEDVFEEETTTKFRNPNDEVVLNAVFYSLQRRYRIQEHLYRARPVILVAMPVPDPAQITSGWIIRYAWILRRALLDDRFIYSIDLLTNAFLGNQKILGDLQYSVFEHTKALKEARYRMAEARALVESRGELLRLAREEARKPGAKDLFARLEESGIPIVETAADLVGNALDFTKNIFGDNDAEQRREQTALVLEAAEDEVLRAERQSRDAETRLTAATSALQQATRDYVDAKRTARNNEVRIAELRVHISDNILHYMQSIWASIPSDQLFFELHNVEVPILEEDVRVAQQGTLNEPGLGGFTKEQFSTEFVLNGGQVEFRSLAEVARLEPIGFKGNLVMFEMYTGNALTDRILAPYLDEHEILRDGNDIAASWSLTELRQYADMLRERLAADEITQAEFDGTHVPFLRATLERLLTDPGPSEDVVIAPANSVFAELLVTGGSLLEKYKLEHRAMDVAAVRSEIRQKEIDNIRRAIRIGTDDYEDPDIEAKYVFEGDGVATVVPPAPGNS